MPDFTDLTDDYLQDIQQMIIEDDRRWTALEEKRKREMDALIASIAKGRR